MKSKWTLWVALLALGLTTGVVSGHAQGAPEPPAAGAHPSDPARDVWPGDTGAGDFGLELADAFDAEDGPGPGGGAMGMGRNPELEKKLNLTDDQRTKLADIRDRQQRAAIPIRSDLELAGLDLRKLMRADKPDPKAIDAQIDKLSGLRARLQKSRISSMLEARAVLTPAQQKILRESRPGMGRGMRRGMHGGPGMRGMDGGPGMHM